MWVGASLWEQCGWVGVTSLGWGSSQHQQGSACETKPPLCAPPERLEGILKVRQMTGRGESCPPRCASVALPHEENVWILWGWEENVWQSWSLVRDHCKSCSAAPLIFFTFFCLWLQTVCLSPVRAERLGFLPSAGISVSWAQSSGCHCLPHELWVKTVEI